MSSFFQMTYLDDALYMPYGIAYAPASIDPFLLPVSGVPVDSWEPFVFKLREGGFADYLSNDLGGRLCSASMRQVIEKMLSKNDSVQWLDVSVIEDSGNNQPYFIMHFDADFPVVHKERSIFAGDMVVKAVIDRKEAEKHSIFALPGEAGRSTFVSSDMKLAMESASLTGMDFKFVEMS